MEVHYRIQQINSEGQNVIVDIIDTSTSGDPIFTDLVGAGFSRTTQTDEDPFKPIRALEATIQFHSTFSVGAHTFKGGEPNRWEARVFLDTLSYLIIGYLATDDIKEPYFDVPNVVTLTATDGLAGLKNVALVDFADVNPKGHYSLVEFLAFALKHTGHELEMYISCGIIEKDQSANVFETCYLEARTFEESIGVSENCYSVLEKILKALGCFLQQRNGTWYVTTCDEMEPGAKDYHHYSSEGVFLDTVNEDYSINIGTGQNVFFSQEDQLAGYRSENNFTQIDFNYQYPEEIIDNINFERGDFNGVISLPADHSAFDVADWTMGRWDSDDPETANSTTTTAYIERVFEDDYEKERFLVLKISNGETRPPFVAIRSNPVTVEANDKVSISVDFNFKLNTGAGAPGILGLLLRGTDGIVYVGTQNGWTTIYGTAFFEPYHYPPGADRRLISTLAVEYPPLPIGGELYVFLGTPYNNTHSLSDEIHYQNLSFNYSPYINGSYRKYTGQYNKQYLNLNKRPNLTDEVLISDSPKPLFKGAIKVDDSGSFVLADTFYNAWRTPTPAAEDYFPLGKLQSIIYWNQYNRVMVTMEGTAQGLRTGQVDGIPDCTWKFILTDSHINADNKIFMCVGFEQDFYTCEWKMTLVEVHDTTIGKEFDADFIFKYID